MSDTRKSSIVNYQLLIILIACFFIASTSCAQFQLRINYIGKDSSFNPQQLKLQTNFTTRSLCVDYIYKLPAQLNLKGYLAASVDSIHFDTSFATIQLYLGRFEHWVQLRADSID